VKHLLTEDFFNNSSCWKQKGCKSFLNGSMLTAESDNGTVNLITALMVYVVLHCNTTDSSTCQKHVTICLTNNLKTIMLYVCLFVVYLTTLTVTWSTQRRITVQWIMKRKGCERKRSWANWMSCPNICVKVAEENHEKLGRESRCRYRDSNWVPHE
jgi:hypothetical protein